MLEILHLNSVTRKAIKPELLLPEFKYLREDTFMPVRNAKAQLSSGEVLTARREAVGLTQEALALEAETSQSTITDLENDKRSLSRAGAALVNRLARALKWSVYQMQETTGVDLGAEPDAKDTIAVPVGYHAAPIIGVAAMGLPEFYPVPDKVWRRGTRVFQVSGDSMTTSDPDSLRHGDWVFVDTNRNRLSDLVSGKVYCIEIHGNGFTVKRARQLNGEWWLMSDNPEHRSFRPDEARIVGVVFDAMGKRRV
jgi:repressor LexA